MGGEVQAAKVTSPVTNKKALSKRMFEKSPAT